LRECQRLICPILCTLKLFLRSQYILKKIAVNDGLRPNKALQDELRPNIAVKDGLCPNITVHDGLCRNIAVKDGLCPNIAVQDELCRNIAVKDGLCPNIAVHRLLKGVVFIYICVIFHGGDIINKYINVLVN